MTCDRSRARQPATPGFAAGANHRVTDDIRQAPVPPSGSERAPKKPANAEERSPRGGASGADAPYVGRATPRDVIELD
jgi:hypothetical protein